MGENCFYLYDSRSEDEAGQSSVTAKAVVLKVEKFEVLLKLENYIRIVYYSSYPATLYFQVQFVRVNYSSSIETAMKGLL